ncbi:MAG TPA: RIP metalloprotease RseP [Oleiagrimonas sp.]|nr:RIP metalloprotease RseP [Oleiagrimonas sp.]
MLNFLGSIWWLAVTLGVLVTFHEFGHFWVARRCGVKVLRFSVGFGRAIWSRTARDGTEYCVAAIPLGGYVKMLDAREGDVPEDQRGMEFTGKPLWQRIAIVAAGPGFNLIFAVLAFWVMFMVGRPGMVPIVTSPAAQTLAAEAGFQSGDIIRSIDGKQVSTWMGVLNALGAETLSRQAVDIRVQRADGDMATLQLPLQRLSTDVQIDKAFDKIGLKPQPPLPVVGKVEPGKPAALAGLRPGDRVIAINGQKISRFNDIGDKIKALTGASPTLDFRIRRGDRSQTLSIKPTWVDPGDGGGARWIIGVLPTNPPTAMVRYGPLSAMGKAFATTWDKTATTFELIGKMLTGHASTRNLSGVITIAQVANTSAQMGFAYFLSFLGLISLSLAVLNLLPIPILDGGHLLYYLIELVKGRPVSERTMVAGQFVGMALIVALVGLAFYNDILRLVS